MKTPWIAVVLVSVAGLLPGRVVRGDDNWDCRTVPAGFHYYRGHPAVPGFLNGTVREATIRFDENTVEYACNCSAEPYSGCMLSWNKLWGSTRCGYLHYVHWDSDRFVWRRHVDSSGEPVGDGMIEIAAYAYDNRTKPYSPPNDNLLQPFSTLLAPGTPYKLRMDLAVDQTVYSLQDAATNATMETKTVLHGHTCDKFAEGYSLSLYYGGQCRAPSPVTICYSDESPIPRFEVDFPWQQPKADDAEQDVEKGSIRMDSSTLPTFPE
eukprot:CAMPEP_0118965446 /NCGR_PEP_ID=MMETSP1173-20130426/3021_1 /TAXON_ID=1034831 /ORGANISM="Rhizochromulina marina cf, Strain CCMP1243" /LENGTH=265 /DNA_ID=CAMNT_0006914071 /DNA_START=9 /DNA_END=806 /DNA_ORIENTATION=-